MKKKIIIFLIGVLVLIIIGGGVFWWRENQKDVRELNKNLPEGVRVTKSLFGKEYKVVNKIDGYEVKIPKEWKGLSKIEYSKGKEEFSEIGIEGILMVGERVYTPLVAIGAYKMVQPDINLQEWVDKEIIRGFNLQPEDFIITKEKTKNFDIMNIKLPRMMDMGFYYFKSNSKIYQISSLSEKDIQEIILNGKW